MTHITDRHDALRYATAMACAVSVTIGCESRSTPARPLQELLADQRHWERVIGFDSAGDQGHIDLLRDAQIDPVNGDVWVLDEYPPYVRRFNQQGQLTAAFLQEGDGPLEARFPYGIGVDRDHVAVLVKDGLTILHKDGTVYRERIVLPVIPEAIGRGCAAGEWVVSGRARSPLSRSQHSGIFAITIHRSGPPTSSPILTDTLRGPRWGRERRLIESRGRIFGFEPRLGNGKYVEFRCPNYEPSIIAEAPPEDADVQVNSAEAGRMTTTLTISKNTAVPRGFAATTGRVLAAYGSSGVTLGAGTRFVLANMHEAREVRVDGNFAIFDVSADGVLLYTDEPSPHLFVLPAELLLSAAGWQHASSR